MSVSSRPGALSEKYRWRKYPPNFFHAKFLDLKAYTLHTLHTPKPPSSCVLRRLKSHPSFSFVWFSKMSVSSRPGAISEKYPWRKYPPNFFSCQVFNFESLHPTLWGAHDRQISFGLPPTKGAKKSLHPTHHPHPPHLSPLLLVWAKKIEKSPYFFFCLTFENERFVEARCHF